MTHNPAATPERSESLGPSLETGRIRADGWTLERQRDFLEALADCGSVRAACARVGMSAQSAYALRRRSNARAFRQAWDAARAMAAHRLEEAAWDRAIHGTVKQHFYHGELVAETRVYSDRLLVQKIDRNRAALDMGETEPEVVEQVIEDWDAALDRLGTDDWLRSEAELDADWNAEWAALVVADALGTGPGADDAEKGPTARPDEGPEPGPAKGPEKEDAGEGKFSLGASTSSTSAPVSPPLSGVTGLAR